MLAFTKFITTISFLITSVSASANQNYTLTVTYGDRVENPKEAAEKQTPKTPAFPTAKETLKEKFNSQTTFNHFMNDKDVRQMFRRVQWRLINTPVDAAFKFFFYSLNSDLDGLFDQVKAFHSQQLEQFSRHALSSLLLISSPTDKKAEKIREYEEILKIVKNAALGIGFSTSAIANMEVYTSNEAGMNAFTVSGNNERLIVVFHAELIKKMKPEQLKEIVHHELGHIWSLHSIVGIMHDLMSSLVVGTYAPSAMKSGVMSSESGLIRMQNIKCASGKVCSHSHNSAHATPPLGGFKDQVTGNDFARTINQGFAKLMSKSPQEKAKLVREYIGLLLHALVAQNGSPETINYLVTLLKTDLISSPIEPNVAQLAAHLNNALQAVSRAQEDSCDRYAIAHGSRKNLAEAMAKLFAYVPNSKDIKQINAVMEMIKRQNAEFKKRTAGSDTSSEAGSTHTSTAFRVMDILNADTYPLVLFNKDFAKLLLMEDAATTTSNHAVTIALQSDILELIVNEGLNKKFNHNFDDLIQYIAFNKATVISTADALKAAGNAKDFAQQIEALETDASYNSALLKELEARLKQENSSPAKARLAILQKLMSAKTAKDLAQIQRSVQPSILTETVKSKVLPEPINMLPPNPDKAIICAMLLSKAQPATKK
jgi:Zn-dependent protease with chaperone function